MKKVSVILIISLFVFFLLLGFLNIEMSDNVEAVWEPEIELSTDIGNEDNTASKVVSENGVVHAVWTDYGDGDGDIYYRFSNDEGKTWEPEQEISQDNATEYQHGSSIDAEGDKVHVVWRKYQNSSLEDSDIYYRYFDGLIWHPVQEISIDEFIDENQHDPVIAVEGDIVHVVWSTSAGESTPIPFDVDLIYRRFNGLFWETPIEIGTDATPDRHQTRPDIAVENGRVHVVWIDNRDGNSDNDVYYRYFNGTSWQPEEEISMDSKPTAMRQNMPKLAARDGKVYVVWEEHDEATNDDTIQYRHYNGSAWEPIMEISMDTSGNAIHFNGDIAVENDKIYVVYVQRVGPSPFDYDLHYRYFDGTVWLLPEEISTDIFDEYQRYPDISVENEIVHVAWQQEVWGTGDWDVYYRRFAPPYYDLQIKSDDISFFPNSPLENGTSVKINGTIHNKGNVDAWDIKVSFFNGDPAQGGTKIGSDQNILYLMAKGNITVNISWMPPKPGTYEIFVAIDYPPPGTISESNETNNIAFKTLEVMGSDYIPWNVPSPLQKVSVGRSVPISSRIMNVEFLNASNPSTIAFYNQSTSLLPFQTFIVPSLNISEVSMEYVATWIAPTSPGVYYVVIEVDYYDEIDEMNENNNTFVITFDVVGKPETTIQVGTPQYGTAPLFVNSFTPFSFSVIDHSGTGYNAYYYVDSSPFMLYSGSFTISTEGDHTIYYYSEDNLGGVEDVQSYNVRVDNTPPDSTITVRDPKVGISPTFINSSSNINLTATDGAGSGVSSIWYSIDSGSWNLYNREFSILAPGFHTIYYASSDNLGQIEDTNSIDVIVDDTLPGTTFTIGDPKYASSQTFVNSSTEFNLTATDNSGSGIWGIWYRIDSGVWTKYSGNFTIQPSGNHTIYYNSTDNLGQTEPTKSFNVNVDNSAPVTILAIGLPQYGSSTIYINSSTGFNLTAMDGLGSGVSEIKYRIDSGDWISYNNNFTISASGSHTIYYYSIDNLGQIEATRSFDLFVDNELPSTTHAVGEPGYGSSPIYVSSTTGFNLTATDDLGSGVASKWYKIDNGNWIQYTSEFIVSFEGLHTIYYYSIDNLGQKEVTKSYEIIVDNTPPNTSIVISSSKYFSRDVWVTSGTEFTLEVSDNGVDPVGVEYTRYRIWNGLWSDWQLYQDGFNLDGEDGIRYVEFYSIDLLGNAESINNRSFIVDNTPPTTTILFEGPSYRDSTEDILNVITATTFEFSVYNSGLQPVKFDYVEYRIWNDGIWSEWFRFSGEFNLGDDNETRYIEWYSTDKLGNKEIINNLTVFVDNIPPTTEYILQLESDNSEARISLISNDIGSGTAFTKYKINNLTWNIYSNTLVINEPGSHTVYFLSEDNLENLEEGRELTVLIEEPEQSTLPTEIEKDANNKPLIAFLFAIILLVVGTFVSMKKPLKKVKGNKLSTWLLVVLPFVVAEAATGIISFFTGILSVPPLIGLGMVVDLTILIAGLIIFMVIYRKSEQMDTK